MLQEMKLRNFSPKTIKSYVCCVKLFVTHYGKSPEELTEAHIKEYLSNLVKRGLSFSTINAVQSALKILYKDILNQSWKVAPLKRPIKEKKLPQILSIQEVELLINSTSNLKHKAILMTLYATGIRLGELCHLKISDVDSKRMTLWVRGGKGKKDRHTTLSEKLLAVLRDYYKRYKPQEYLFNGEISGDPISERTIQYIVKKALDKSGINKKVTVHTLRHCFATHLLEKGTDLFTISQLLGHQSIRTTTIYLHLQNTTIGRINNPLDSLNIKL